VNVPATRWALTGAVVLLVSAEGWSAPDGVPVVRPAVTATAAADTGAAPCPADGRTVPAGTALQAVIDSSPSGATICLMPGTFRGPVVVTRRLSLIGPAAAVINSNDTGTTLRVLADSVTLRGFSIDGSGTRYDRMDAAVYLRGRDVQVNGLTIHGALFGIIVEQSDSVVIADNRVTGLARLPVGIRGDGIRLWEVRHSRVERNRLTDSRDILVWYSPGNIIRGNTVTGSRYATHFMYSDDCLVADADYRDNIVGVFVMYSRGVTLRNDIIADNMAPDGLGLGVKESGNLTVVGTRFVHDRSCLYLDTSPFRTGDSVLVRGNRFVDCDAGVTFHSSEHGNAFLDNVFEGNATHVAVEGRGTAQGVQWRGNYFDDYQGYDLNGDGIGDVPYELRDLSEQLVSRHPALAFFRGTIALKVLNVAADVFPVLQPVTLLRDSQPRMAAAHWRDGANR
jgi:nitrous oxidase accessory protein